MDRYIVQEYVRNKWYTVRSFTSKADAEAFAAWLGKRARVVQVKD
jgi:hypothetical protein